MISYKITSALVLLFGLISPAVAADAVEFQTGSDQDGQQVQEAGQVASATDPENFDTFCNGKTLTNGTQVKGGSCNPIVMGNIPAVGNMVSTIITSPTPGQDIAANTDFKVTLQLSGLDVGHFTNAATTYYSAPQDLAGGLIIGHTHVTIQDLGGTLTPTTPPNAQIFAFFKGVNDAGNGKELLTVDVAGGLPAGFYRVCTMSSAQNHQPVLMPVAQRGAQDDCQKFTVGEGNKAAGAAGGAAGGATGGAKVVDAGAKTNGTAAAGAGAGGKAAAGNAAGKKDTAGKAANNANKKASGQRGRSGKTRAKSMGAGKPRGRYAARALAV